MRIINNVRRRQRVGFTLVEIMIVVAIIGLLAAIGIPNFIKARQTAQANTCINNLRVIDESKQQWALEKGLTSVPVSDDLVPYLGRAGNTMPFCPLSPSGTPPYNINPLNIVPSCPNTGIAGHTNAVLHLRHASG